MAVHYARATMLVGQLETVQEGPYTDALCRLLASHLVALGDQPLLMTPNWEIALAGAHEKMAKMVSMSVLSGNDPICDYMAQFNRVKVDRPPTGVMNHSPAMTNGLKMIRLLNLGNDDAFYSSSFDALMPTGVELAALSAEAQRHYQSELLNTQTPATFDKRALANKKALQFMHAAHLLSEDPAMEKMTEQNFQFVNNVMSAMYKRFMDLDPGLALPMPKILSQWAANYTQKDLNQFHDVPTQLSVEVNIG